jgi:hypothetical protein
VKSKSKTPRPRKGLRGNIGDDCRGRQLHIGDIVMARGTGWIGVIVAIRGDAAVMLVLGHADEGPDGMFDADMCYNCSLLVRANRRLGVLSYPTLDCLLDRWEGKPVNPEELLVASTLRAVKRAA